MGLEGGIDSSSRFEANNAQQATLEVQGQVLTNEGRLEAIQQEILEDLYLQFSASEHELQAFNQLKDTFTERFSDSLLSTNSSEELSKKLDAIRRIIIDEVKTRASEIQATERPDKLPENAVPNEPSPTTDPEDVTSSETTPELDPRAEESLRKIEKLLTGEYQPGDYPYLLELSGPLSLENQAEIISAARKTASSFHPDNLTAIRKYREKLSQEKRAEFDAQHSEINSSTIDTLSKEISQKLIYFYQHVAKSEVDLEMYIYIYQHSNATIEEISSGLNIPVLEAYDKYYSDPNGIKSIYNAIKQTLGQAPEQSAEGPRTTAENAGVTKFVNEAEHLMRGDFYTFLGIQQNSSEEEIAAAIDARKREFERYKAPWDKLLRAESSKEKYREIYHSGHTYARFEGVLVNMSVVLKTPAYKAVYDKIITLPKRRFQIDVKGKKVSGEPQYLVTNFPPYDIQLVLDAIQVEQERQENYEKIREESRQNLRRILENSQQMRNTAFEDLQVAQTLPNVEGGQQSAARQQMETISSTNTESAGQTQENPVIPELVSFSSEQLVSSLNRRIKSFSLRNLGDVLAVVSSLKTTGDNAAVSLEKTLQKLAWQILQYKVIGRLNVGNIYKLTQAVPEIPLEGINLPGSKIKNLRQLVLLLVLREQGLGNSYSSNEMPPTSLAA